MSVFSNLYVYRLSQHSIPTRRSSDLAAFHRRGVGRLGRHVGFGGAALLDRAAGRRTAGQVRGYFRSEEHTSELQSLTNLGFRLLLEKKKGKSSGESDAEDVKRIRS